MDILVNEREKTKEWVIGMLQQLYQIDGYSQQSRNIDVYCWNQYHNNLKSDRFDYFLTVGSNYLPAQARHIPIQKHFIDSLSSQQIYRPFNFSVKAVDENTVADKNIQVIKSYITDLLLLATQKYHNGTARIDALDQKMAQIQQALQQQPQNEQQAQQQQQLAQYASMIEQQFNALKEIFAMENKITRKETDDLQRFYKFDYKDFREHIGQKLMNMLRQKLDVKNKSNKNFISYVVTGKQYYYVDMLPGRKWPEFETVDSIKLTFPLVSGIDCVSKGPWVKMREQMSFNQIVLKYGDLIKEEYGEEKLKELQEYSLQYTSTNVFVSTTGDDAMVNPGLYSGTFEDGQGIEVEKIWYKVPRKVQIKYSPNPYKKNEFFRHFVDKMKIVINDNDYTFKAGRYYKKDDDSINYDKDEVEILKPGKGQKLKTKYTNDIYYGYVINGDIYLGMGKMHNVYRPQDRHSDICLPIFGPTFSTISDRPYSLIWNTKDLQELIDVIHTQRELMLALAGTKSFFYDRAQKPGDLTDDEWEYQKKLGNIWISTYDKDGHRIQSSFNQWAAIDLSVSPAIQYLDNMLVSLEDTMGNIIGVPRQRLGQTINSDQVGTFKESINRSMLITEILYNKHDQIEARALQHLLNLTIQFSSESGILFEMFDEVTGREFFKFTPELFKAVDFDLTVMNNSDQMAKMEDLRNMAMLGFKSGVIPFQQLFEIFNSETLVELKHKTEQFVQKAQELAQQNQQQEFQNEMEIEKAKVQFAQEFEKYWRDQDAQLKAANLKLQQAKIQSDAMLRQQDQALTRLNIETNADLKLLELQNEQAMETAVLVNNDKHATIEEQLKAIGMRIDAVLNQMNLGIQEDQENKKRGVELKKVAVEDKKTEKMVKEKTSDR